MKHRIRATVVIATIAAASALALPLPAQASSIYPPSGSCTVSPTTVAAGGTVGFQCAPATFSGNESVTITVTGENGGAAEIGMVAFAITTASGSATSEADGSLDEVSITLPADATGTYNIAAISPTSAGGTAAVTVSGGSGGLPITGLDGASLMGLWIAGGALVVTGGVLAVAAASRRSRGRS